MTAPTLPPGPGAAMLGNVAYIPPGFEGAFKTPFTYQLTFPAINAQTLTLPVNVNNDAYFACVMQTATIWDSATQSTTQVQPSAYAAFVVVQDTSSGRNLMNSPVPFASYFGSGIQPFVFLYRAQIYLPGGQITVQLQSLPAVSYTVTCSFHGFKVYYNMPDQLTGPVAQ